MFCSYMEDGLSEGKLGSRETSQESITRAQGIYDGALDRVLVVDTREASRFEYVLDKDSTGPPSGLGVGTAETLAIMMPPGSSV